MNSPAGRGYRRSGDRGTIRRVNADTHELERSLDSLWQCLSQSKRPLALLLGAGCPVSIRVETETGEVRPLIEKVFGIDPELYDAALEVRAKYLPPL